MTLQYRTIEEGRLRFEGPDAASFLHALVTNDVEGLAPGRGCYAAWLTPQGRMITDLLLLRDESGVWAEVPEGMAPALQARFDQLIFSEDVRVTDVTSDVSAALVVGDEAAVAIATATGADASAVGALPVFGHLTVGNFRVVRTDETALPSFQVWGGKTVGRLFPDGSVGKSLPTVFSPGDFVDAPRIEAGRPKFGVDMTTDTIPLEAGLLDRAISQTKGCYVGQEVIVRILHRGGGKVVRHLMTLEFDEAVTEVPQAGTSLAHDGKDVGNVTSAARRLSTGRIIALGYVHRDAATAGQVLQSPAGAVTITGFAG
jgi:folate-binding protein YgfZ